MRPSQNPSPEEIPNGQQENDDYTLVSKLTELSSRLTKDVFINQIITDLEDLEDIRIRLFETVKASESYPYDQNVEMKTRKHTYGGDSKLQKLAKDVYTLVQILEVAEFHELREILSTPHTNTNLDCSILNNGVTNNAEIETLKRLMNGMKADILALKEQYRDIKTNIDEEDKGIKESVKKIQIEIGLDMSDFRMEVNTNAQSIDRIVDEKSNGNASFKSDIRLINNEIKDIQDVLTKKVDVTRIVTVNEKQAQITKRVGKLEKRTQELIVNTEQSSNDTDCRQRSIIQCSNTVGSGNIENENVATVNISIDQTDDESDRIYTPVREPYNKVNQHIRCVNRSIDQIDDTNDRSYAEVLNCENTPSQREINSTKTHVIPKDKHVSRYAQAKQSDKRVTRDSSIDHRDNNLADDVHLPRYQESRNKTFRNSSAQNDQDYLNGTRNQRNIIRGRGSAQPAGDCDNRIDNSDDSDFYKCVHRRVKRLYVGGFNNTITTDKLIEYVQKRGVTVTWVTIFPIRRSNRVLIRLNVEDNDNSDYVLDESFWPRYIVCKSWMSKNFRERQKHTDNTYSKDKDYSYDDGHYRDSYYNNCRDDDRHDRYETYY